ncbi:energy transducer TonB [Sphingomonas sp. XXL09]|uniref:energy transducer TonB n=1 Tax=Sphingomonas sp. XXL09 TaxID=3457787 RepID=UPI00406BD305
MIDMTTALPMILVMQATTPATAPQADPPRAASPSGYEPPFPIGSQGDWFPFEAYPPVARRAGQQGRVLLKLAIDAQGKPTDCTVTESSGFALLDAETCSMAMRNARFHPARQSGVPVASTYQLRGVRWALTDNAGPPTMEVGDTPNSVIDNEVELSLTASGAVAGCKIIRRTTEVGDPCIGFPTGKAMFPPLQHNGMPVTARARYVTTLTLLPAQ